jgi:Flp pilus assembly protein TadG
MLSLMSRLRDERGVSMVLFAVVLPVVILIGVLSVDVGNWFVHKKRLQTLVDAGALAAGNEFTGCFQDDVTTNDRIAATALEFAGDRNRDPSTRNVQEQEASPGDVHVVLNSNRYWATGDAVDDGTLRTTHDNTWATPGKPCDTKAIDVKATDDKVPLLFGFVPVASSPHAYARVEIRKVLDISGLLPFSIPEVNPAKVAAIIVDEDAGVANPAGVRGAVWLNNNTPSPPPDLSPWDVWHGDMTANVNGSENFGVVIMTSRDPNASLTGSLQEICGQDLTQVRCFGYPSGMQTGLSFIHAYSDASPGGINPPAIRGVQLFGGCGGDLSAPYFNLTADGGSGSCTVALQAKVDFGVGGDPTDPNRPCAELTDPDDNPMTWVDDGSPLGIWEGSVTFDSNSGRNVADLKWKTDRVSPCGGQTWNGTFPKVAVPYAANPLGDPSSGPVEYLWVSNNNPPFGAANSINGTSSASLHVTVGLTQQIVDSYILDPPIRLRYASIPGSQNQAVDCDKNVRFEDEIINGCQNPYRVNQRNGSCTGYNNGNLPEPPIAPLPGDDCLRVETGDKTGPIRQAMGDRFGGTPCKTRNNWPKNSGDPLPDFDTDPRVVTLFITDENTFTGSGGEIYPIRRFANFYITSADGMNCDFPGTQYDDQPLDPGPKNVWGHWITFVTPNPNATPSDELCAFDEAGACIAVLVE